MKPFKVVDASRDFRVGLTASCLSDLIDRAKTKLEISGPIRVVLELDGTEIDDNDYFNTLEADTSLMVLSQQEQWTPYKSILSLGLALEPNCDEAILHELNGYSTPGSPNCPEDLVWRLHQDLSFFPWLTPQELETIAKMDTEQMKNIIPDEKFLVFLQDLSERYLSERGSGSGRSSNSNSASGSSSNGGSTTSILHDPIKLIRMYSKSNHGINGPSTMYGSTTSMNMDIKLNLTKSYQQNCRHHHHSGHRELTNGDNNGEF